MLLPEPGGAGYGRLPDYRQSKRALQIRREVMESIMEDRHIGWIAAIIIGGIAGWLAEQFMRSNMGLLMNILLGVIGAALASWLFGMLGMSFGGWLGYLIAGFIGACILILIVRAVRGSTA
jgi:uncharacterized membrane protein YeaQ/YmgE (transglycosylase-associated protein family)